MEITEVRIKLMDDESGERLKAFCSITFDDAFVVRDLKIIEGANGPFVAMPSRKLTAHCPHCGCKNHLRATHCNHCGRRLSEGRIAKDHEGRAKLYADIAHPINSHCREMIQQRVIQEFHEELRRAQQDGYVSRYDDLDLDTAYDGSLHRGDGAKLHEFDGPQVQPSQPEPRAPHHVADGQAAQRSESRPAGQEGFGAGIFD